MATKFLCYDAAGTDAAQYAVYRYRGRIVSIDIEDVDDPEHPENITSDMLDALAEAANGGAGEGSAQQALIDAGAAHNGKAVGGLTLPEQRTVLGALIAAAGWSDEDGKLKIE